MNCRACGSPIRDIDEKDQLCSHQTVGPETHSCVHRFNRWAVKHDKASMTPPPLPRLGGAYGHGFFDFTNPRVVVAFDEWLSIGAP